VSAVLSRRLVLPPGEVAALCGRLDLLIPPGFEADPSPIQTEAVLIDGAVHPSVAAGLAATCIPRLAILLRSSVGDVAAALGIRGDLGGSMVRAGQSDIEVGAWPAARLGAELARAVPVALPGVLHITVVAPPRVVGQLLWRCGAGDVGSAVAPLIAAALA
jgi:hypothetical protein